MNVIISWQNREMMPFLPTASKFRPLIKPLEIIILAWNKYSLTFHFPDLNLWESHLVQVLLFDSILSLLVLCFWWGMMCARRGQMLFKGHLFVWWTSTWKNAGKALTRTSEQRQYWGRLPIQDSSNRVKGEKIHPCTLRTTWFCMHLSSVQSLNCVQLFATPWTAARQASCRSPTPGTYSNSCPQSQWCHPTISSSIIPFSSCLQSFVALGSFPMSQFFTSGGQSIGVSASASVLPVKTQDWSPLGWTGWISLQSKGLSRVFSNTTVQKHKFLGTQISL